MFLLPSLHLLLFILLSFLMSEYPPKSEQPKITWGLHRLRTRPPQPNLDWGSRYSIFPAGSRHSNLSWGSRRHRTQPQETLHRRILSDSTNTSRMPLPSMKQRSNLASTSGTKLDHGSFFFSFSSSIYFWLKSWYIIERENIRPTALFVCFKIWDLLNI